MEEGRERVLIDNWDEEAVRGQGLHQVVTEIQYWGSSNGI